MGKQHREVVTRLHVTQHEQRDEDDTQNHQDRKPDTVLTGLKRERHTHTHMTAFNSNTNSWLSIFLQCLGSSGEIYEL